VRTVICGERPARSSGGVVASKEDRVRLHNEICRLNVGACPEATQRQFVLPSHDGPWLMMLLHLPHYAYLYLILSIKLEHKIGLEVESDRKLLRGKNDTMDSFENLRIHMQ
jgi:hypothetical protein